LSRHARAENRRAPARRVGRPEKPLDPASGPRARLAWELRELREACYVPTFKVLEGYAGVDQRRLSDAARDGSLPSWHVVERYVRGCWDYLENAHGRPLSGAGDLDRWRQLYREAGGRLRTDRRADGASRSLLPVVPDRAVLVPLATSLRPAALPHAPLGSHRRRGRLAFRIAAGLALLIAGMIAGIYAGTSQQRHDASNPAARPASGKQHVRMSVSAPAPMCGLVNQNDFRSPATTSFSSMTQVDSVSLDGISATIMQGVHNGAIFDWLESHPTGIRAGIQLRWASADGRWHYCTATDEGGSASALPDQVTTIAIPSTFHGKQVTFQACIWHQHPYTAQCGNLYSTP
jgi:hypothetical protein